MRRHETSEQSLGKKKKPLCNEDVPEEDSLQWNGGNWSPGHPSSPSGSVPTPKRMRTVAAWGALQNQTCYQENMH